MKLCVVSVLLLVVAVTARPHVRRRGSQSKLIKLSERELCRLARKACKVLVGDKILKDQKCGTEECGTKALNRSDGVTTYTFYKCPTPPKKPCKPDDDNDDKSKEDRPRGSGRTTPAPALEPLNTELEDTFVYPPQSDSEAEIDLCDKPLWETLACLITNSDGEVVHNKTCDDNGQCSTESRNYTNLDSKTVSVVFCKGCDQDSMEDSSEEGDSSSDGGTGGSVSSSEEKQGGSKRKNSSSGSRTAANRRNGNSGASDDRKNNQRSQQQLNNSQSTNPVIPWFFWFWQRFRMFLSG